MAHAIGPLHSPQAIDRLRHDVLCAAFVEAVKQRVTLPTSSWSIAGSHFPIPFHQAASIAGTRVFSRRSQYQAIHTLTS